MTPPTISKEEIVEAIDDLSPESLSELREYIDFLHFKLERQERNLVKLGGLWKELPPVTEEEIDEARHEMWGSFGERDI